MAIRINNWVSLEAFIAFMPPADSRHSSGNRKTCRTNYMLCDGFVLINSINFMGKIVYFIYFSASLSHVDSFLRLAFNHTTDYVYGSRDLIFVSSFRRFIVNMMRASCSSSEHFFVISTCFRRCWRQHSTLERESAMHVANAFDFLSIHKHTRIQIRHSDKQLIIFLNSQ